MSVTVDQILNEFYEKDDVLAFFSESTVSLYFHFHFIIIMVFMESFGIFSLQEDLLEFQWKD